MADPRTLYISMRAKEAAELFANISRAATESNGRDGAFAQRIDAVWNDGGQPVAIVFNNDDMERGEMDGCTIMDWSADEYV